MIEDLRNWAEWVVFVERLLVVLFVCYMGLLVYLGWRGPPR